MTIINTMIPPTMLPSIIQVDPVAHTSAILNKLKNYALDISCVRWINKIGVKSLSKTKSLLPIISKISVPKIVWQSSVKLQYFFKLKMFWQHHQFPA